MIFHIIVLLNINIFPSNIQISNTNKLCLIPKDILFIALLCLDCLLYGCHAFNTFPTLPTFYTTQYHFCIYFLTWLEPNFIKIDAEVVFKKQLLIIYISEAIFCLIDSLTGYKSII